MTIQSSIQDAQTIVVGGGIAGCSVAYHLAQLGHTDVLVIDRGTFTDPLGSTGHAPGLLGRNSGNPTMAEFADYTADLFSKMPAEKPALTRVGSVEVARNEDELALLRQKARTAATYSMSARLITPDELKELIPYLDTANVIGAIHVPDDGALDARRALLALRDEAADAGVRFIENMTVTGFEADRGRVSGIHTDQGVVRAENVVVAVGIWGQHLLSKLGINLALTPVQHPYVYTVPLDFLSGTGREASRPLVRDLQNVFYLREHGDRLGFGWYGHEPAMADVAAITRADITFPEDGFRAGSQVDVGYDLFPFLRSTPVAKTLNGIFSMTPDGGPLIGEVEGWAGLWVAEAVWITHSGGVGRALAELILDQPATIDVSAFRPDRFDGMAEAERVNKSLSLYNDIYSWPAELAAPKCGIFNQARC